MLAEREAVVRALRSRGDHDGALQAQRCLPLVVDLEQDAGCSSRCRSMSRSSTLTADSSVRFRTTVPRKSPERVTDVQPGPV